MTKTDKVLRLLDRGIAPVDVAKRVGVRREYVYSVAHRKGVKLRGRNGAAQKAAAPDAHRLLLDYARPFIMAELKERLGV